MNQTLNNLLSRAQLKDRAKDVLTGNYGRFALALFIMMLIKLGVQLALELVAILIYTLYIITNECIVKGLSVEELEVLVDEMTIMQPYLDSFTWIDYAVVQLANVFNNVFAIGVALFALNLACGNTAKVSDIFYGYRYQFGKTLKLSALFVLLNQMISLPCSIASYLADKETNFTLAVAMLGLSLVGVAIYLPIYYTFSQAYFLSLDFPGYSVSQLLKLSGRIMKGHKFRFFILECSFLPLLLLAVLSFGIGIFWVTPYMQVTYAFFFLNLMQTRSSAPTNTQESC